MAGSVVVSASRRRRPGMVREALRRPLRWRCRVLRRRADAERGWALQFTPAAERPVAPHGPAWRSMLPWLAALSVVVGRLPWLRAALGTDESGFLLVGGQWAPGGRSLYGDYFVDRPPLLLTIFKLAAALGGAVPLRVLGMLAAVVTVLATARAAERAAGVVAGWTAAVLAASLLVNPLAGSLEVDGELLAAPFTAVAVAATVELLCERTTRGTLLAGWVAGASGTAAVLVKQNMLDAAVFGCVTGLLTVGALARRLERLAVRGLIFGALSVLMVTGAWTASRGTSLGGVLYAMYPFRWAAGRVLVATHAEAATQRAQNLVSVGLVSGMALLLLVLAVGTVASWTTRRGAALRTLEPQRVVLTASAATSGYAIVSVVLGGSYWTHYLVELVVPLSLGAGVALACSPRRRRTVVAVVAAAAVLGAVLASPPGSSEGERVGGTIRSAAHRRDTIVTIWGHSDVDYASGLSSPYPQLWSLPTRTLDPKLTLLTTTLAGADRPTWFVAWPHVSHKAVDTGGLARTVARHYHPVASCEKWTVYLRDGADRPVPAAC